MTDPLDFDKLKSPAPKPDDDAKSAALQMARARFEEKKSQATQGNAPPLRPTGRSSLLQRIFSMDWSIRKHGLPTAFTSVVVIALGLGIASQTFVSDSDIVLVQRSEQEAQIELTKTGGGTATLTVADAVQTTGRASTPGRQANLAAPPTTAPPSRPRPQSQPQSQPQPQPQPQQQIASERAYDGAVLESMAPVPMSRSKILADGFAQSGMMVLGEIAVDEAVAPGYQDVGRDQFEDFDESPVKSVAEQPVSTFSIDVDTASYGFVRRMLMNGVLPQKDAVRIEEMVNYFDYDYAAPETLDQPFTTDVTLAPTPWNAETLLMRVGIKGYELADTQRPRANLVFLLDVSGSMNAPDKLPLLKNAFNLLLENLDAKDTVAIVTYAGHAGVVLEPTPASEVGKIRAALNSLTSGGGTAGAEGIKTAYDLAEQGFDDEAVNRVILATDGDFNVGIYNPQELQSYIERKRETGVYLSVLGFGQGNLNDALMQKLAQNGNGVAAYIDTLNEARKVLVDEASSSLFPIAEDVKIQVEFNPARVAEYRLIGYETRALRREDFNNDAVDAGEIGSGHEVTALYEIVPTGSNAALIEPLRYGQKQTETETEAQAVEDANEWAFLRLRYKQPGEDSSKLIERPITEADRVEALDQAPDNLRFAAAVAGFGQILRGERYTGRYDYGDVIALAQSARGQDEYGYRAEFINLVRLAKSARAME